MISFIIPTYNEASVIANMLEQFKSLKHIPYEVIVSDNKSEDATRELANEWANLVVENPHGARTTIGATRNRGAAHAQYPILVFIDSAVYIQDISESISKIVAYLQSHPQCVGMTVNLGVLSEVANLADKLIFGLIDRWFWISNNIFNRGLAHGKFMVIRKDAFEKIVGFNEKLVAGEDVDLFSRLAKIGKTFFDRSITVLHPARRPHAYGWPKLLWIWTTNGFAALFLKRSARTEWESVREDQTMTVIIPAYNEEKYIRDCLNHVMAQSVEAEIIVVDNGSTDLTATIARSFERVKVITEQQVGVNYARQRGLLHAHGDLIAYVDADTLMPQNWLARARAKFSADEKLMLLSGPYIYHDHPLIYRVMLWIFWRLIACPGSVVFGYLAIGGNLVARKIALEESGGFDSTIEFYGDDAVLARRMHKIGKVKFSLGFYMYTSARRFTNEGFWLIAYRYVYNYLRVVFTKRPATLTHKDIR